MQFEIWDKDMMFDDSLGKVTLDAEEFAFPKRFVGLLELDGKQAGKAKLQVRVMDAALLKRTERSRKQLPCL